LRYSDAATIPIIVMSANAFAEIIQPALAAGMNAHVAKLIGVKTLLVTLEKNLFTIKQERQGYQEGI